MELSSRPFIASHSNVAAICNHSRNLSDEQIKALIALDGRMGLTFFPAFVRDSGKASSEDMLRHIEHVCSLGGEKHLMFGSDFDGIDSWVENLEHPGKYPAFADLLLRYYPEESVTNSQKPACDRWDTSSSIPLLLHHSTSFRPLFVNPPLRFSSTPSAAQLA